jgi:hypothetical protein
MTDPFLGLKVLVTVPDFFPREFLTHGSAYFCAQKRTCDSEDLSADRCPRRGGGVPIEMAIGCEVQNYIL